MLPILCPNGLDCRRKVSLLFSNWLDRNDPVLFSSMASIFSVKRKTIKKRNQSSGSRLSSSGNFKVIDGDLDRGRWMASLGEENHGIFLLATTTEPERLDPIIQRWFEGATRIHMLLPNKNERAMIFKAQFEGEIYHQIAEDEWMQLAAKTEQ